MKLLTERDCRVIGRPNVLILSDRLLARRGRHWSFFKEGLEIESCREAVSLVMSPNAKRVAWIQPEDRGFGIYLDGEQCGFMDSVSVFEDQSLFFSPDSSRVAAIGLLGGKTVVVVDGAVHEVSTPISNVVFSPDSNHWFLVCKSSAERFGYKEIVYYNGSQCLGPYDDTSPESPIFSHDGKQLAIVARQGRWFKTFVLTQKTSTLDIVTQLPLGVILDFGHRYSD